MKTASLHTTDEGSQDQFEERALSALDLRIPRPKTSFFYRLGAIGVAFLVALLPAVYLALIVALAWGMFYHATQNVTIFENVRGRGALWIYLTPLFVGGIGLIFMVKPFVAKRARGTDDLALSPDRQPFLFEFVDALCRAVGAPRPKKICVDCEVNASAGFHQGRAGLSGDRLVLTIGLPLVHGLSLQELTGVLAHEFGHFSQGAGMRINLLIRKVLNWFARAIYERDAWDVRLESLSRSSSGFAAIAGRLCKLLVWTTRQILFALMWIGHATVSYFSRQMEFDADSYEVQLVGAETFERTMRRITELSFADRLAHQHLSQLWQDDRLVDDLPQWVVTHHQSFTAEQIQQIHDHLEDQEPQLFATHPRDIDRIAAARRLGAPGHFAVDAPATALFESFEALSRQVTLHQYKRALGPAAKKAQLLSTRELFAQQSQEAETRGALVRFLQAQSNFFRLLGPDADFDQPCEDAKQCALRVRELRQTVLELAPAFERNLEKLIQTLEVLWKIRQAALVHRIGGQVTGELADVAGRTTAKQRQRKEHYEARESKIASLLEPFEAAARERLTLNLRLLSVPTLAARIESASSLKDSLPARASALRALAEHRGLLEEVQQTLLAIELFVHREQQRTDDDPGSLERSFERRVDDLRGLLQSLRDATLELTYPFEHAEDTMTVGRWLVPSVPKKLEDLFQVAQGLADRYSTLYFRLLGHLCQIGEVVEQAMGLSPLPPFRVADEPE